mmetsp:Transcript_114867/g.202733  ORF Transcript_114867/g.202733 Transcript_114867/m.202733 type:complete len:281 (+) Transcript_114867:86-928(+)
MVLPLPCFMLLLACAWNTHAFPGMKELEPSQPMFPTEFRANISWSCHDGNGKQFNAWTGQVYYSWPLRALRTDVQPPAIPQPEKCLIGSGPPINGVGTFLLVNGTYFVVNNTLETPTCALGDRQLEFGIPRPTWVQDWRAVNSGFETVHGRRCTRWEVDVARQTGAPKEAWDRNCFQYLADDAGRPCRFGGGFCTNGPAPYRYPAGIFEDYLEFEVWTGVQSVFDLPASCPSPSNNRSACHGNTCSPGELAVSGVVGKPSKGCPVLAQRQSHLPFHPLIV